MIAGIGHDCLVVIQKSFYDWSSVQFKQTDELSGIRTEQKPHLFSCPTNFVGWPCPGELS
jgi:hypothetical protein